MLGRRKEEPNRTFLDRKCAYLSVKLIRTHILAYKQSSKFKYAKKTNP